MSWVTAFHPSMNWPYVIYPPLGLQEGSALHAAMNGMASTR